MAEVPLVSVVLRMPGLSQSEKLVLAGLADHLRNGRSVCWPSLATLAEYAGVSERSVRTTLRSLEGRGLVITSTAKGRGNTSRYRLDVTLIRAGKPEAGDPFSDGKPEAGDPFYGPDKTGSQRPLSGGKPEAGCTKTGSPLPPNPKEPLRGYISNTPPPVPSGCARDARSVANSVVVEEGLPPPVSANEIEEVRDAAGVDLHQRPALSARWLDGAVIAACDRWRAHGLTHAEIVAVVGQQAESLARRDSYANSPNYFDAAIARFAEAKRRPMPDPGGNVVPLSDFERREAAKRRNIDRLMRGEL